MIKEVETEEMVLPRCILKNLTEEEERDEVLFKVNERTQDWREKQKCFVLISLCAARPAPALTCQSFSIAQLIVQMGTIFLNGPRLILILMALSKTNFYGWSC